MKYTIFWTSLLLHGSLFGLLLDPEDGGVIFQRNVGGLLPNYRLAIQHRRSYHISKKIDGSCQTCEHIEADK
jgi:hypothetical protein